MKSELKVREFEVYNAWYCAVCHSIRDRYGQIPRLLLTYDSVFLAMLLGALKDENNEFNQFRCLTHPAKIRNVVSTQPEIDYAADIMILLGYYNLRDDYEDEKSVIGLTGSAYLKRAFRRINGMYPEKSAKVKEQLNELSEVEKSGSKIFDEAAEPFSRIMEEIFDSEDTKEYREQYRNIGFHLGKWIYLIDAFDDLEKDIKKHNYNPILRQFDFGKESNSGENLDDFKSRIKERIRLNLTLYLANIGEAVDELPMKKNKEIINNIVYLGLMGKTDEILDGKKEVK